jgi:hypothetical protein
MKDYYIPDIIEKVKSGIIHIVHVVDGKRVSSGTGFMVNGYLVTNYHVINHSNKDSYIVLRTYDLDPPKHNPDEFLELEGIKVCRNYNNFFPVETGIEFHDYCVLDIPELKERSKRGELYNFLLDSDTHKKVGEEILFTGYHFDHYRIVSHRGFISSFYTSTTYDSNKNKYEVDKIQIDASVNSGSSGSPLIDPNTSRVIGIVTRKETGLSKEFDKVYEDIRKTKDNLENHQNYILSEGDFYSSMQNRSISQERSNLQFSNQPISVSTRNIQNLENSENIISSLTYNLSGSITQLSKIGDKLTDLAKEIERSANVGIGYAYSVEHLMNENFYVEG